MKFGDDYIPDKPDIADELAEALRRVVKKAPYISCLDPDLHAAEDALARYDASKREGK